MQKQTGATGIEPVAVIAAVPTPLKPFISLKIL
jgi:hypothetical protein